MTDHANDGHRERLRARFTGTGGAGVADYELLELALTFAIPRKDVKPLAKEMLRIFGNLSGVMTATPEQLAAVKGLGPASVAFIQVVQQLALRVRREKVVGQPLLASRLELLDYLYTKFASVEREEFHVLYMDSKMKLVADEKLFSGTLHEVTASPRDVLKRALELNSSGIIVAHNHPSGNPEPSAADFAFTEQLMMACAAMGVDLHDHVVVGTEAHYSFSSHGKL
ncbi:MAG: DNA repair protein RadC [Alphaproteobacteria bacterium]|nr:MAG: DNA repair protein RadC [Alphaproteobacteria bacterium]